MAERLILAHGTAILPSGEQPETTVICRDGKIEAIVRGDVAPKAGDVVISAEGKYISPGFIDIHVHGGGGHDFMDGTVEAFLGAARAHAEHGTTALVPTTLTAPDDELFQTFDVFREASAQNTNGAKMIGLHLEGPYFSPAQSGAQDPRHLKTPVRAEYERILEAAPEIVRWSVAPELPGALEMGRVLKSRGVLASIAHTDAVCETVEEAFVAGYTHATHLYSAMSSVVRRNAFRYAGAVEAAYLLDGMTVEVIADGVHLPRPLLQFAVKFKGVDRVALCTDAMRGAGMPDGESILGSLKNGQKVVIEDGVAKMPDRKAFAGSVATTDRLVRTMRDLAGCSLADAVRMMTATPARILGLDDKMGSLEIGKAADLVVFNEKIEIDRTIRSGRTIYEK